MANERGSLLRWLRSRPDHHDLMPQLGPVYPEELLEEDQYHSKLLEDRRKAEEYCKVDARFIAERAEAREQKSATEAHRQRLRQYSVRSVRESFKYGELQRPSSQVRLLEIGIIDRELVCVQSVHELSEAPSFVAISYTWGSSEEVKNIVINGRDHQVRENCYNALFDLASVQLVSHVWIDSVCINQEDDTEKAQQVQMMTSIFAEADWVAAIPEAASSVRDLKTLGKPLQDNIELTTFTKKYFVDDSFWKVGTPVEYPPVDLYFGRLWIVQELLVARQVKFIRDGFSEDWDQLHQIRDTQASAGAKAADVDCLVRLVHDRGGHIHDSATASICHYLARYGHRSCQNPRDILYALVPMALRTFDGPTLTPNYVKSLFLVLRDFVHYICKLKDRQPAPLYDVLICIMDLLKAFTLDLRHDEIRSFLSARSSSVQIVTPSVANLSGAQTLEADYYGSEHFRGICLSSNESNPAGFQICQVTNLRDDQQQSLTAMGIDLNLITNNRIVAICLDSELVFVATSGVLPGDILLTPGNGMMAWTWNLIFRSSAHSRNRYDLVGQAVPVKGKGRASLNRRACCQDPTCPARKDQKWVNLHSDDLLSLAILGRAHAERLGYPITVPFAGSHAVIT